jgi:signal transduction histidine kinase
MAPEVDPPARDVAGQVALLREENAALLRRMAEGERRFRLIARRILRVQEAERARVSRELHDGLGQSLTALRLQLELARREAAGTPVDARLADAADVAASALGEVRQIAHLLRPQMLDQLGLFPTLRWLARTFEERTGIAVELDHDADEARLDPEIETLVFRVVQEAVANAGKHAGTPRVAVSVRRAGGALRVEVGDEGRGFDVAEASARGESGGFGLRGMRERVRLFGGTLRVVSAPGAGTRVAVEVPMDGAAEEAR